MSLIDQLQHFIEVDKTGAGAAFKKAVADLEALNVHAQHYTAHRCEHGLITSWSGESWPGLIEPPIHHCEQCNPGTTPLNTEF